MLRSRRDWLTLLGASTTAAIAGCSGDDSQDGNESKDKEESDGTTDTPVSEIALSEDDLPNEFSLQDRTPRTESDVSDRALELGWKEGYNAVFVSSNAYLEHLVARYPPENISGVWEIDFEEEFTSELDATLAELPDPDIGSKSKAYRVEYNDRDAVGYIILTTRADIYQAIILVGERGADYEFAKEMARSANANVR